MRLRAPIAGTWALRAPVALACALVVALAAAAPAPAAVPNLPWTRLLPPLPSGTDVQPGPVRTCRQPTIACVDRQIKRMRRLRNRLGCDHRAIFATTYLELTKELRRTVASEPGFFRDRKYFFTEDAVFANVYFDTFRAYNRGVEVADAWRIAFQTAATGQVNAAQDMLLGINAHVQNDMPFVLASVGLRQRDGTSRKPDHDAANEVLNRAYQGVVDAIEARYDPIIGLTNPDAVPLDDVAGLELVKVWRELVWRNAERLATATSAAQRAQVATQIEANAALWAQAIATIPQPGYRAQRDAYCARRLAD